MVRRRFCAMGILLTAPLSRMQAGMRRRNGIKNFCVRIRRDACSIGNSASVRISTGEFHYPPQEAAETAVATCRAWLHANDAPMRIVFNVFKDEDLAIYRRIFQL